MLTSDQHKLGEVVNLLNDLTTGRAEIVVFPRLVMKLVRTHSGNIAGQIAGQAIGTLKRFVPGADLVDIAIDQASGYAGMRTASRVKRTVSVIEEAYYLVPFEFVSNLAADTVRLGISDDDCKKWCLNAMPSPEVHVSFFDRTKYQGPERKVSINLNTPSIENNILQDASGLETVVKDIELLRNDSSNGSGNAATVRIIVNDPRPQETGGQVARAISVSDVVRQESRLIANKSLSEYPSV